VQAELLDSIAQIQRSLGLFDPAYATAEAALAGRQKLFGPGSPEAALSRTTLAEVAAGRGRLQDALQLAEQARPVVEQRFGMESPEVQRLTRLRAILLNDLGEPEKALDLAQGMAEAARRRFGPDSVETARRLITVATILGDLSRFAEAERMTREGLGVLETSPEATRVERADARRNLAELVLVQGRQQESVTHFAAALDLQRAALGPKHAEVAFTLIPYGYVLSELRRYHDAEQALREAIRILEPLDHYEIGTARKYLGFCLMGEERYAEAERQFAELVQFLTARVGPDHPSVWGALMTQGIANLRLGRLDAAENQLSRVVVHFETTLPGGDGDRSALKHLAELRRLQGRPAEALDMHRRALEMERKLFGSAVHPGVAFSHYQIALDLLDLGLAVSLREARTEIDQAIAMLTEVDAGHPFIDKFLVASGRIALAAGDRARARQDLAKAVERLRGHRGANDSMTREAEALLRGTS
jgi:tetratricopeptide (TPR) repeat protein